MAGFIVNGVTYKSKKAYFFIMNPDVKNATQNDIDRYLYHNLPEYHHHKRIYYREKYRKTKDNKVRMYRKYSSIGDCDYVSMEDIHELGRRILGIVEEPVSTA